MTSLNKILNPRSEIQAWIIIMLVLFILMISPAWAEPFSFVVFGDNRDGDKVFKSLVQKMNQEKDLDFAVNTGDFISNGKHEEYLKYLNLISSLEVKAYHVMGNHDGVNGGWKHFKKYFGPDYYSFGHKGSYFIVLNNAFKASFDWRQYNWLKKELKDNRDKNLFVFFHKPLFDPSETYKSYVMSPAKIADDLQELFSRYKVKYVFSGHIHGYGRQEKDGVVYVVTGGAGAPLYLPYFLGGFYHYVRIDVDGDKITETVRKLDD